MEHSCSVISFYTLKLYKENGTWYLKDIYNDVWLVDALFCPYCGVDLNENTDNHS
jgi:hypothetical protein